MCETRLIILPVCAMLELGFGRFLVFEIFMIFNKGSESKNCNFMDGDGECVKS